MNLKSLLLIAVATLGLTTATLAQVPNYVPTNGLVSWWPFNGNANDESGNGNNGQIINAVLVADRNGNPNAAYSFDGSDDWISVPDHISLRPSLISLSCWINQNNLNLAQLIYKGNDSNGGNEMYALNSSLNFAIKNGSNCNPLQGWQQCLATNNSMVNTWHHIVCTFDGTTMKIYYDAALIGSFNFSGIIDNCVGGELRFGKTWSQEPFYFNGIMDDIGMWDRALTAQEITDLFNGSTTVGVNSSIISSKWNVFPNPARTHITVDYGNFNAMSGYTLKIVNSVGQTVFTTPINQQTSYIDLSTWSGNGIYFMQLIDPQNNAIENRKIVIQ